VPLTPGWDVVGVVDRLGDGVSGIAPGQTVAALPISEARHAQELLEKGGVVGKFVLVPGGSASETAAA